MITIYWADARQTTLFWRCENRWTQSEYLAAQQHACQLILSHPHTVDVVIDLSRASMLLPDTHLLMQYNWRHRSDKLGRVIIISPQDPVQNLRYRRWLGFQKTSEQFTWVGSLDEAQQLVQP